MLIIAVDREGSKCRRVRLEGKSVRKLRHEIDRSIHYTQPRRTFNPFLSKIWYDTVFRLPNQQWVHAIHVPYDKNRWFRIDAVTKKWVEFTSLKR